jgi:Flp pilus assembly pilin Flp
MQPVLVAIGCLAREDDAQDLVEYGLLAALIAATAVVAVTDVGRTVYTVLWSGIATAPW